MLFKFSKDRVTVTDFLKIVNGTENKKCCDTVGAWYKNRAFIFIKAQFAEKNPKL